MDQAVIALYHRHVAAAYDRQRRLADFLDRNASGQGWNYTISTATLELGAIRFEAFYLGSHADPDNSWLWAWCNPHLNLTPDNRELGDAIRKLGRDANIPAIAAEGQVSCADLLGPAVSPHTAHVIAAVVAGELGFDAYYTIPFEHGRAAAVIRDDRLRADVPNPVARIVTVFPQAISALPVPNHRVAFVAYARWYGLAVKEAPQGVSVLNKGKEVVKAEFDHLQRLTELTGTVGPDE